VRLLLDTHIWLWSLIEPARLPKRVATALRSTDNEIWLSPISVWETLMLAERKRITIAGDAEQWVTTALRRSAPREAPFTFEVAARSTTLSLSTRDPADRFIAASAAIHGLTLVTADSHLSSSREYAVLPS
jgi:PIN domain nuclease of toxin-antitoxin system